MLLQGIGEALTRPEVLLVTGSLGVFVVHGLHLDVVRVALAPRLRHNRLDVRAEGRQGISLLKLTLLDAGAVVVR